MAPDLPPLPPLPALPTLGDPRVCIADSNPHMRRLLCDFLSALGISNVVACGDGRELLWVLEGYAADLCIVDLGMQPMDGMALLKHLRTADHDAWRTLPIIMVADAPHRNAVAEAREHGGVEFLLKPVTVPALAARIHTALRPGPDMTQPTGGGSDTAALSIAPQPLPEHRRPRRARKAPWLKLRGGTRRTDEPESTVLYLAD